MCVARIRSDDILVYQVFCDIIVNFILDKKPMMRISVTFETTLLEHIRLHVKYIFI